MSDLNTSTETVIGTKDRFNWGVLFWGFIWFLRYKQWLYACIDLVFIVLSKFIPLCSIIRIIFLICIGKKGNVLAKNTYQYKSEDEFQRIQKIWAGLGLGISIAFIVLIVLVGKVIATSEFDNVRYSVEYKKNIYQIDSVIEFQNYTAGWSHDSLTSAGLANVFHNQIKDTEISSYTPNTIICTKNKATYTFNGDGKCTNPNACSILIDTNGELPPNVVDNPELSDRTIVKLLYDGTNLKTVY